MAIRPSDLQGAIFQVAQSAQLTQRTEEAPRQAAQAAQAAFVAGQTKREETVAATGQAEGNRVTPDGERRRDGHTAARRRAATPSAEAVDEAAGLDEPPHLIDVTA